MSAKKALENYLRRNSGVKKTRQKRSKNEAPEKLVEKEVVAWCKSRGMDISVVESKAVYSPSAGRYLRGQAEAGFSDLVGTDASGTAVFIELKAAGKRNTIRPSQLVFLQNKIARGAFAACVDSARLIDTTYNAWAELRLVSIDDAKKYLLDQLPKSKSLEKFSNELPW